MRKRFGANIDAVTFCLTVAVLLVTNFFVLVVAPFAAGVAYFAFRRSHDEEVKSLLRGVIAGSICLWVPALAIVVLFPHD